MIAVLNETIVWWHWIVLGFILLILEMNTGTFVMLGLRSSCHHSWLTRHHYPDYLYLRGYHMDCTVCHLHFGHGKSG